MSTVRVYTDELHRVKHVKYASHDATRTIIIADTGLRRIGNNLSGLYYRSH